MTSLENEIARHRRAFASLARRAVVGSDCPAPERLWEAVGGLLPAEEIRELVDHTASCASCAEDWRLAHELAPEAGDTVASFPATSTRHYYRWGLAAAAVLVALIAVPLSRDRIPVDSQETVRAPAGPGVIRSQIEPGAVLSRDDCVLSWSSESEPMGGYDLLVATGELEVLIRETGLAESSYRVPAEVVSLVPGGGTILWRVEATLAAGRRVGSPTFVHQLR